MPLRALLLDVGNTLVRETPSRFVIYAEAARKRGIPIEPAQMRARMARAHRELPLVIDGGYRYSDPWFRAFIERVFGGMLALPRGTVAEITAELFERFEAPATFRVVPGAHELLRVARGEGLVVGVVSNWSARLPRVLSVLGLESSFDFVLCSALEGMEKPDPAFFRAALAHAHAAPGDALHAGDDWVYDVEGARGIGIEAVLVDHDGHEPSLIERARTTGVRRVTTLEGLASIILERGT